MEAPVQSHGVGAKVTAKDCKGTWLLAKVEDERGEGGEREIYVKFDGWKSRYNRVALRCAGIRARAHVKGGSRGFDGAGETQDYRWPRPRL